MSNTRLIHGFHAVTSLLRNSPENLIEIYLDASRNDARSRDLVRLATTHSIRVLLVDSKRLDGLAGGGKHQGVVAKADNKIRYLTLDDILDPLETPPLLLVLDGVKDPHNLGACLRVADAAGVNAVIAPKDRACGLSQTAIKVASGAAETTPYITVTNLARTLRELKERNIFVIGMDDEAQQTIYQNEWPTASAWVLGAESEGLRRLTKETCDILLAIPMLGSVSSLNVSVAAGICLFEARRKTEFKPNNV